MLPQGVAEESPSPRPVSPDEKHRPDARDPGLPGHRSCATLSVSGCQAGGLPEPDLVQEGPPGSTCRLPSPRGGAWQALPNRTPERTPLRERRSPSGPRRRGTSSPRPLWPPETPRRPRWKQPGKPREIASAWTETPSIRPITGSRSSPPGDTCHQRPALSACPPGHPCSLRGRGHADTPCGRCRLRSQPPHRAALPAW